MVVKSTWVPDHTYPLLTLSDPLAYPRCPSGMRVQMVSSGTSKIISILVATNKICLCTYEHFFGIFIGIYFILEFVNFQFDKVYKPGRDSSS